MIKITLIRKSNSIQIKKKNIEIKFYKKANAILKDQLRLKYKLID
jgi:hypothetical protein